MEKVIMKKDYEEYINGLNLIKSDFGFNIVLPDEYLKSKDSICLLIKEYLEGKKLTYEARKLLRVCGVCTLRKFISVPTELENEKLVIKVRTIKDCKYNGKVTCLDLEDFKKYGIGLGIGFGSILVEGKDWEEIC